MDAPIPTTAPPEPSCSRVTYQRFSQPRKNAKSTYNHGIPTAEELHRYFVDEQQAVSYLRDHGGIDCIQHCPNCGGKVGCNGKYQNNGCWTMQCNKQQPDCCDGGKRWKQSVFKFSVLSDCRKPKNEFFHFLYLWVNKTPPNKMKTILGWSWDALVKCGKSLREICTLSVSDDSKECGIGGPGRVVAIHESKFVDDEKRACTNTAGYKRHFPKTAANKHKQQGYLFEQMWRKQHEDDLWFGLLNMLATTRKSLPT
jgi:hypothetical protein